MTPAAYREWDRARQRRVARLKAAGLWEPFVDAEPARRHVRWLIGEGITGRRVAVAAGVAMGSVSALLYGVHGLPPSRKLRRETADALLAVRPAAGLRHPGGLTDPTGTHRRLQALIAVGWSRTAMGRHLGMYPENMARLVTDTRRVRNSTAAVVAGLYDDLWDTPPDESTPQARKAATTARREAARKGWPPPVAWDDDAIDNPAAGPAAGWRRRARQLHESAALAEDALWLVQTQGYDRARAAARLGVSRDAVDKAIERTAKAGRQEDRVAS